MLLNFKQQSE